MIPTLVGTVATVLSVFVAMGIGPFDLSSNNTAPGGDGKGGAEPATTPEGSKNQTTEGYIRAVKEISLIRADNATKLLNDLTASTLSRDLARQQTAPSAASAELKNTRAHIRAVSLSVDPEAARPFTQWRKTYDSRVDAPT